MGLTPQQERFAQEVASGKSQAEAYRIAYPKSQKWKPATLWREASKLMVNPKVSTRVEELRASIAKAAQVETVRVVQELARVALSDVRKVFHEDGRVKSPHELDDATAAAVSSVEFDPDGGFKVKLWDKNSAADKLMKHLGAYERDNKQGGAGLIAVSTLDPAKLSTEALAEIMAARDAAN